MGHGSLGMLRVTAGLSLLLPPPRPPLPRSVRGGMMGRLYIVSERGGIKSTNKELLCFAPSTGLSIAAAQLDHKTRLNPDCHLWFGF